MAQTKKSSTGKSTKSASAKTAETAKTKSLIKQKKPKRREIGAVVCLFLAIFALIAYFSGRAVFISFFRLFVSGLLGWGFYAIAPALAAVSFILFFHRGRPVRLRMFCVLLLPLLIGAVLHLFLATGSYKWGFKMLGKLYTDGKKFRSGGMLGGLLAKSLKDLFSIAGAAIVLICAIVIAALGAANMTIIDAFRRIREHEKLEYEPEEEPEEEEEVRPVRKAQRNSAPAVSQPVQTEKPRRINTAIDIPVDDPPQEKKRGGLFKKGGIKSPDQVYRNDEDLTKDVPQAPRAPMPIPETGAAKPRTTAAHSAANQMTKPMPNKGRAPVKEQLTGIRPESSEIPAHREPEAPAAYAEPAYTEQTFTEPAYSAPEQTAPVFTEPELPPEDEPPFDVPAFPREERPAPAQTRPQAPAPAHTPAPAQTDVSVKKLRAEDIAAEEAAIAQSVENSLAEVQQYNYPPTSLLHDYGANGSMDSREEMSMNRARLENTLRSFGINATISNVTRGPSVARYEMELEQGVKLTKLTNLADDIALSLGASSVRIAPIPNQISMVGIEVPNKQVDIVYLREIIESEAFAKSKSKVTFALGKDIGGNCICGNIEKLPHMLIAGTTGSGKSVCINSLIISLIYKASPDEVKLIMIDPKMIELGVYNGIPHLLIPVVTDPKKAAGSLQWAVNEMMKRYRLFAELGARDIHSYNEMIKNDPDREKLPQVVIVIDELADLMLVAAKEIEDSICRIAQMARAAGMHLVIATQRPSADVITGIMKANIPSRIAFAVASSLESRIILDTTGAEKLVGHGDMLYCPLGAGKPLRIQGTLIEGDEVEQVVSYIKQSGAEASYDDEIISEIERNAASGDKKGSAQQQTNDTKNAPDDGTDELFPQAVEVILECGQASVSMLQRRLKLGYSRAARLVDQMEERGIVGPYEGSKPRQLLISKDQWYAMQCGAPLEGESSNESVPEEIPEQGNVG